MLRVVSKRVLGVSREVPWPARQVLPQFSSLENVGSFNSNINGNEKTGMIADARFKTFGYGLGVTSSSAANEWVKGKQMEGVPSIKNIELAKHPSFHPFKLYGSMFADDAIKAGIKSYEGKRTLATATDATSGEKAASPVADPVKRLRPISPHLSVYKPQSSSMSSIFFRISGITLASLIFGSYLLCLKVPSICFTYTGFNQFFQILGNFDTICASIGAVAMSYHLINGIRKLPY